MNLLSLRHAALLAAGLVLSMIAGTSHAAVHYYGDLSGTNVEYLGVEEDSTPVAIPRFGAPLVSVDALAFNPSGFGASASGGTTATASSILRSTVMAKSGRYLTNLQINEDGDYTLIGTGTQTTSLVITAPLEVRILEIDGSAVTPIVFNTSLDITPNGGVLTLAGTPGVGLLWNANIDFDIVAALMGMQIQGHATKIDFMLTNTFTATSETGSIAFIANKEVTVNTETAEVPLPMGAWLGLAGAGLLGAMRRRNTIA